jgi:hypothetical protein
MDSSNAVHTFRREVVRLASIPTFKHCKWYVRYHLLIVEQISHELCNIYTQANRDLVTTLVWLHDYGKITNSTPQAARVVGKKLLYESGFEHSFRNLAIRYTTLIDRGCGMDSSPLELQIVSSADGASHLAGPFYLFHWYENYDRPYEILMAENSAKMKRDWERKITLPEVRRAFATRHSLITEMLGDLPETFLLAETEDFGIGQSRKDSTERG